MIEMLTGLLASKFAIPALATVAIYVLGLFAKSETYSSFRAFLGRVVHNAGATLSRVATSKLGRVIWGPIEAILTDYVLFLVERFAAGLRSDNVEKLATQASRLESVGSIFQREAVESKLDLLRSPSSAKLSEQETKILAQFQASHKESAENKLKG
jgi:hypothetical protein